MSLLINVKCIKVLFFFVTPLFFLTSCKVEPVVAGLAAKAAKAQGLDSLRTAVEKDGLPLPSTLAEYVKDNDAAIRLGKAFFWDMQVASDGVTACASCHHHAGTDNRVRNAINPGLMRVADDSQGQILGLMNANDFPDYTFQTGQVNGVVSREDFPLVKYIDSVIKDFIPETETGGAHIVSPSVGNSNEIIGSVGVTLNHFDLIVAGQVKDEGTPIPHPVFNIGDTAIRQVGNRNSPSVINSVFNNTQFWDGRGNPFFNGQNQFGINIPTFIIVNDESSMPQLVAIQMDNGSLAGQVSQPVTEPNEQGFGIPGTQNTRTLPQIGHKMLGNHPDTGLPISPLALQRVHKDDSVLGSLSNWPNPGIKTASYAEMIRAAFHERYWNSDQTLEYEGYTFTHMEANFALFFGLSIMLYEATLVADQSPYDQWLETGKLNSGFGVRELTGLKIFVEKGCVSCHAGPELTDASIRYARNGINLIRGSSMHKGVALYDTGFHNIGVTPTSEDIGRGGSDFRNYPLAFSRQALVRRLGLDVTDNPASLITFPILGNQSIPVLADDGKTKICADENKNGFCDACVDSNKNGHCDVCEDVNGDGFCGPDEPSGETGAETIANNFHRVAVDGAFKTPGLRNVELTGPYFHNGGVATLKQVVQFFNRGGNFCSSNSDNLSKKIKPLGLSDQDEDLLVAFLISLTDKRVKYKKAPFDHPELFIPADGLEEEPSYLIEATGRNGATKPLEPFLGLDPYDEIYTPKGRCESRRQ